MKNAAYILLLLFIIGCKRNNKPHEYNIATRITYDDSITNNHIASDSLYIFFQSSFYKDSVKVVVSGVTKFKKVISTDQTIGLAENIVIYKPQYISQKDKCIQIAINNNSQSQVCNYNRYKFMLIDKDKNGIKISLTNKTPYYK